MTAGTLLYFAYGSNMLTQRLQARCPGARAVGPALAPGYTLRFCKRGRLDDSGKAALLPAAGEEAWGVLFELPRDELPLLDAAEGLGQGYARDDAFAVVTAGGEARTAATYRMTPDARDDALMPFEWYLALTIAGARQHGLPADWIARLRAVEAMADPEPARSARLQALGLLEDAGFPPV